jgi:hypothetical protein
MQALLTLGAQMATAVKEAMLAQSITIFTASGYAAGQQAPHLMLHIIPREPGDGLSMLDIAELKQAQPEAVAIANVFAEATRQALVHKGRADLIPGMQVSSPPQRSEQPADVAPPTISEPEVVQAEVIPEFDSTQDALQAALHMNPDLRRLIIAQPDLVQDYVARSPKLSRLFEGVDIRALSLALQRQESAPLKIASQMSDEEIFKFIDGNEGLRTWMIENPEEFAERLSENKKLSAFFANVDVRDLARRYRERGGT